MRIVINEVACDKWLGLRGTRRKQIANRELLGDLQETVGLGIPLPKGFVDTPTNDCQNKRCLAYQQMTSKNKAAQGPQTARNNASGVDLPKTE